jgi:hypothetical protein
LVLKGVSQYVVREELGMELRGAFRPPDHLARCDERQPEGDRDEHDEAGQGEPGHQADVQPTSFPPCQHAAYMHRRAARQS